MKTRYSKLLLLLALFFSFNFFSQNYTWKKGTNMINQTGIYGTVGVAAPGNNPGGREAASSWKDASGNFWLFGGFGLDFTSFAQLNDLWKYTPSTNQWTFIKGDSLGGQSGIYGSIGSASPSNKPGARNKAASWKDASGNFWLFGGNGYDGFGMQGYLNDLWKYNPSNNQWTWIKGSSAMNQAGTYGTQGVANITNKPGAREGAASWTDGFGNLWLFGGFGFEATSNVGQLNDLWKYDITSNQWTWMKGSSSYDQNGTYGIMGTPALPNTPGGRRYSTAWTDVTGNFWLLGGYGYPASGPLTGHLNDLWKYDPVTNQWVWIKGSNSYDQLGIYGTQGVSSAANYPGSRVAGQSWTDATGNLWLMGGTGMGISLVTPDYLNDLWRYNIASNQWTWIKGGNTISQAGVYGTQGVPSALNTPGGRVYPSGWIDANFNLWLFGGSGYDTNSQTSYGFLNDMWKFGSCTSQTISVVSTPTSLCAGGSATLVASGANSYLWNNLQSGSSITVSPATSTIYVVHSADPNGCGDSAVFGLNLYPLPVVTASGSNTFACYGSTLTLNAFGASTYTWDNNQSGASILATAITTTVYTVTGTDGNGCKGSASVTITVLFCPFVNVFEKEESRFSVFPNPSNGFFKINSDLILTPSILTIYNTLGEIIYSASFNNTELEIDISSVPNGVYFAELKHDETLSRSKIIKN